MKVPSSSIIKTCYHCGNKTLMREAASFRNVFEPPIETHAVIWKLIFCPVCSNVMLEKTTFKSNKTASSSGVYITAGDHIPQKNIIYPAIPPKLSIPDNVHNAFEVARNIDEAASTIQIDNTSISKKVFISHSSKDSLYVKEIVNLLESIGINGRDKIFCSSVPGYTIKSGNNFLNYIKNELQQNTLTLFILSDNFYASPICLCEMGATWINENKFIPILIPPFKFEEIKGVISESQALKINDKYQLLDCYEQITDFFNINKNFSLWDRKREDFLTKINSLLECNPSNDLPNPILRQSDKIYSTEHPLRDRELFLHICEIFPQNDENSINIIRYYNLVDNPLHFSKLYGLEDFSATALNPASYFFDSELENLRLQLIKLVNNFSKELETNFQHDDNEASEEDPFYYMPKEWAHDHPEAIQSIRDLAKEISNLYDQFIKLGKLKFAL